ncbi:AAA family ATPase [Kitasatospora sp. NPDC002227]|uniref:AAA family ATPase n=1 Tax=Kitasatospora sp. NPDC002227 TaxID=3154773 RepID=UPI0033295BDE
MRLHHLEITAFGPFAGTEQVDFDQLAAAGLFLLRGATGAGKSSVLDAVCYALYGEVPGTRKGNPLRSDHADPLVLTRIRLEVTLGGRRLEITRSPEQPRPKKRGAGTTIEKAATLLREWSADAGEGEGEPGWRAVSRSHQEAGEELRRLIGMSREQFCQVVLLPQGDFARFLRADAGERASLLRQLFDTGRFEQVEKWLAEQRRGQEAAVSAGQLRLRDLAARAEQAAGPLAEPFAPESAAGSVAGPAAEPAAEVLGWAAILRCGAAEELAVAGQALRLAESAHESARLAADRAAELADRQRRHREAATEAAALTAATPRAAADADRLAAAQAAQTVETALRLHTQATTALTTATAAEQTALATLATLGHPLGTTPSSPPLGPRPTAAQPGGSAAVPALETPSGAPGSHPSNHHPGTAGNTASAGPAGSAVETPSGAPSSHPSNHHPGAAGGTTPGPGSPSALSTAPTPSPVTAEALAEAEHGVREQLGRLVSARAEEQRWAALGQEEAKVQAERARTEAAAEQDQDWLVAFEARLDGLRKEHDGARAAAAKVEQVDAQRSELAARLTAAQRRDALLSRLTEAEGRLLALTRTALDARGHSLDLRERRLAGMAAELAARLAPGEPCRVCGAAEHPAPARPTGAQVTAADERRAEEDRSRAEQAAHAAEEELTELKVAEAAAAGASGGSSAGALRAELSALEELRREALRAADSLAPTTQRIERLTAEESDRRQSLREAGERSAVLTERSLKLAEERAELGRRVAEARGEAPSVAARGAALAALAEALTAAVAAVRARTDAAARLGEATRELRLSLSAAGFTSPEAARAALLPAAERAALESRVRTHQSALAGVEARLADHELLAAAALPPADQPGTQDALRSATARLRDAAARERSALERCTALTRLSAELTRLTTELAPELDRFARISRLAALAAGTSNENVLRMRLESYVLAARLEQVAAAASRRLVRMSGGRYTLVHSDDRASGNRRSGLALRVVDAWTGRERDTATLSGGESFFASLALALGLADVVTDEAGGMPLDTLFVDEGFGSLDEQALEEVMDVLDGLRERDRAVGIVSHVPDLRTRIPAQLHIRKTRRGSTLRLADHPLP